MTDAISKYAVYMLKGLPAGVFGEAYAVVTNTVDPTGAFFIEHYILTQRPQESLKSGSFNFHASDLPSELGVIDADFAMKEGLNQAEMHIIEMLEERSVELDRPDVALLQFDLQECEISFVGCKMRGQFLQQFADIRKSTKCPSFSRYMTLLQQVNVFS